jgi:hypothetical protein
VILTFFRTGELIIPRMNRSYRQPQQEAFRLHGLRPTVRCGLFTAGGMRKTPSRIQRQTSGDGRQILQTSAYCGGCWMRSCRMNIVRLKTLKLQITIISWCSSMPLNIQIDITKSKKIVQPLTKKRTTAKSRSFAPFEGQATPEDFGC